MRYIVLHFRAQPSNPELGFGLGRAGQGWAWVMLGVGLGRATVQNRNICTA